jgi:fumarate hydratase class I
MSGETVKKDLTREICELIRITSTDLPEPVEKRLRSAQAREVPGSAAYEALRTILENVDLARKNSIPVCQDTGVPVFYVRFPLTMNMIDIERQIRDAVALATRESYLRPNAVDPLTGTNSGNNLGNAYFPSIHYQQMESDELTIDLILKGGGCENVGFQYSLPDERLKAGRDLEGVRKAALDAVFQAQGQGCSPGFLGVAIGGDRETSYAASKEAFLRDLNDQNPDLHLRMLEAQITNEANQLGIGPMGFGGKSTILETKIKAIHRLPACYFVTISYMCWAFRRRRMRVAGDVVYYE